jgi:DNA repair/transcription protein MET18/MMS19
MDVLFTMAYCVSGYSTSEVVKWASKLWDSLKFEVWNGDNNDTVAASLSVISNIAKSLSNPTMEWDNIENPCTKSLLAIIVECNRRLIDAKPQDMVKTGSILHAIAESTPYAFFWVARKFLPVVFTLWQDLASEASKAVLLTVLNKILEARVVLDEGLDDTSRKERDGSPEERRLSTHAAQTKTLLASSLVDYQRNLIDDIYFSAMTDNISNSMDGIDFRAATINGLVVLMGIQSMLSDFEKGTIIESLNSILLQPNQIDTVRKEAVSALQKMSSSDPVNFQKITLANFMSKLPKNITADKTQSRVELDSVIYLFDSLVQIACTAICNSEESKVDIDPEPRDRVFTAFQKALVSKLINVLEHNGQLQYANIILGAIYQGLISYDAVLDLKSKSSALLKLSVRNSWHHPYAWIVSELCKNIIEVKQLEGGMPYVGFRLTLDEDEETVNKFVSLLGNITTLVLRSGQTTTKNNFFNSLDKNVPKAPSQVWSLFIEDAPESLDNTQLDLIDGPADKFLANVLSTSLVAGVRRKVSHSSWGCVFCIVNSF